MSEQKWWTRDAEGKEHPDDAVLLAFVRNNLPGEEWLEVFHHFSECTQCQNYCRVGRLIYNEQSAYEANESVADAVEANESVADAVMEYINNPVRGWLRRQDRRLHRLPGDIEFVLAFVRYQIVRWAQTFLSVFKSKKPSRLSRPITKVSLTWVFSLLLIAVVAAILLAPPLLNIYANPGRARHASPSHTPSPPTPTPSPTPTPTHAPASQPLAVTIQLCGTSPGRYQERIDICGSHFHPGDKLELIVYVGAGSGPPKVYRKLTVDAQGQFQTFLVVTQCRETIKAISITDVTNSSVRPVPLTNIQVGSCEMSPRG